MEAYGLFIRMIVMNYRKFRKAKEQAEERVEEFEPRRSPSGGSFAKVPENPKDKGSTIIENMMYIEPYENNSYLAIMLLSYADDFIQNIKEPEIKKAIIEKFVTGNEPKFVACLEIENYTTNKGIWRSLDREIERYIVENRDKLTRMTGTFVK